MATDTAKSITAILNSKQYKELVDNAIAEVNQMTDVAVAQGMNAVDAETKIKQLYLQNLQTFSNPAVGSIALAAELKTRIDADRILNPETNLVSDKYIALLAELRETLKLIHTTQKQSPTSITLKVDDSKMKFDKFIDVDGEVRKNE